MNKVMKKIAVSGIVTFLLLTETSCARLIKKLDVVGEGSITAFEAVLNTVPNQVKADEENGGWSLSAQDETARFLWSEDWSGNPRYDVMLEFEAQPFIEAGLNVDKLPEDIVYYENMLKVGRNFGESNLEYSGESTPLAAYEQIVNLKRDVIGYHMELDHFGIDLENGNIFEWAKDMNTNDKDIVFALNPEPLIQAGVDPNAVDGWIFTKVKGHVDGKLTETDKLLKIFDLK